MGSPPFSFGGNNEIRRVVSGWLFLSSGHSQHLQEVMASRCTMSSIKLRRVLICGDRLWTDLDCIKEKLLHWHTHMGGVLAIIEGEARGADTLGCYAAEAFGIPVLKFPADWGTFGKSAGPIRNRKMLTEGKPDVVLAFHNDIANSKGTKDMVKAAAKAGVEWHVYTQTGEANVRIR